MNGISALMKEAPGSSPAPSAMGGHGEKMAIRELGSWLSPDTEPDHAGTLILDFQSPEL